ncbi:MAG: TlpA family protein disulfide reductase [Melioribacter sp.]|nr:TlpA family protein disulfide reductase [Melioribacter sp.]
MISSGKVLEELLAAHKIAYTKVKGSEDGYEKYLSAIKEKFLTKFKEKIKSSLVEKSAPAFALTDLDGKKVSLSDLKGKIVILDFWATWCGPCKASFPLMKKTLEKYSDNNNVEFLFVNTWEKSGEPGENASKYLKENKYPFHCIIDPDGKITAQYEVMAIPTKIFIDKEGKMRYKSTGADLATMLEEIDTVINLIK